MILNPSVFPDYFQTNRVFQNLLMIGWNLKSNYQCQGCTLTFLMWCNLENNFAKKKFCAKVSGRLGLY